MTLENKLVIPAGVVGTIGLTFHGIKFLDGGFFPAITEHIGDFSLLFSPTMFSGHVAVGLDKLGERYNLPILRKIADYFPEVVGGALAIYATLGESIMDIIPGNTKDLLDIPAALLATGSGYVFAKCFYKNFKKDLKNLKPKKIG